jgi:hypothetical protein
VGVDDTGVLIRVRILEYVNRVRRNPKSIQNRSPRQSGKHTDTSTVSTASRRDQWAEGKDSVEDDPRSLAQRKPVSGRSPSLNGGLLDQKHRRLSSEELSTQSSMRKRGQRHRQRRRKDHGARNCISCKCLLVTKINAAESGSSPEKEREYGHVALVHIGWGGTGRKGRIGVRRLPSEAPASTAHYALQHRQCVEQ